MRPSVLGLPLLLVPLSCASAPDRDFFDEPGGIAPSSGGSTTGGSDGSGGSTTGGSDGSGGASSCGNGTIDDGEECDDGNAQDGDGCTQNCQVYCADFGGSAQLFVLPDGRKHCYWLNTAPASFGGATTACQGQRGHLVSIHSEAENAFVHTLNPNTIWTGGTDGRGPMETGGGAYGWVSGEAFGYSQWDTGEPNNYCGCANLTDCCQHCAAMVETGLWRDRACETESYPYVCEYSAPGSR
jgi:cysteine-rich repeat protein